MCNVVASHLVPWDESITLGQWNKIKKNLSPDHLKLIILAVKCLISDYYVKRNTFFLRGQRRTNLLMCKHMGITESMKLQEINF